jgi:hypothetical protein
MLKKCTVQSELKLMWYIAHDSSPEIDECVALEQEVGRSWPRSLHYHSMPPLRRRDG